MEGTPNTSTEERRPRRAREAGDDGIEVGAWNGYPNYRCPKCSYAEAALPGDEDLARTNVQDRGRVCNVPGCPIRSALEAG